MMVGWLLFWGILAFMYAFITHKVVTGKIVTHTTFAILVIIGFMLVIACASRMRVDYPLDVSCVSNPYTFFDLEMITYPFLAASYMGLFQVLGAMYRDYMGIEIIWKNDK